MKNNNLRLSLAEYNKVEKLSDVLLRINPPFDSESKLELDYSQKVCKDIIEAVTYSRLPDIKRVKIDKIENNDKNLKSFLKRSRPESLKLLNLNREHYENDMTEVKYYTKELKKWFQVTTDEIYIENLDISSKDLCNIIKASSNCSRLVIRNSKIKVSEKLDFSINDGYKIKQLSFSIVPEKRDLIGKKTLKSLTKF